jgi:hypothetical protein
VTRRLVSVAFGVTLGVLAMRRATALRERVQPGALAGRLMLGAGEFVADVRVAMAEREQELRSGLGLGVGDGVDADVDVAALEARPADGNVQRLGG